jgi:hypothetical protein
MGLRKRRQQSQRRINRGRSDQRQRSLLCRRRNQQQLLLGNGVISTLMIISSRVFICLQNSNFTGGVWSHSPRLDAAGMSLDEAYSYVVAAHGVEGLTYMTDPEAPAVRYAGTMPNGTRIWWVNLEGAALNEGADQNHPLECKDISNKAFSCQWIPTANPKEWAWRQDKQTNPKGIC